MCDESIRLSGLRAELLDQVTHQADQTDVAIGRDLVGHVQEEAATRLVTLAL